jgi:predicted 3-demethylubiquinone-9 3-methyltransferase (glyoxalase superfamily)
MQKITPFLWFNNNALEAAEFYASIFKTSEITNVTHMGQTNSVMSVSFVLEGQAFLALNGGPHFSFTPAISLFVDCETQAEVDDLWERLSAGGEKSRCGWLQDKFGLSWQIIPKQLGQLMGDPDPVKSKRVMDAMMQMNKIIIADLQKAYDTQ